MSDVATRYDRIARTFTERVGAVPAGGWERPAPCKGWVARDVVRHLTEWLPAFFFSSGTWATQAPAIPSVDDDPVAAWAAVDAAIRSALADPELATSVRDTPMGAVSFEDAIDMICTSDVFLHTWDLCRATGQDERLDPVEVHRLLLGMEPMDEVLRGSGHYGPRVPVPEDADEQTRLLAFIGRTP